MTRERMLVLIAVRGGGLKRGEPRCSRSNTKIRMLVNFSDIKRKRTVHCDYRYTSNKNNKNNKSDSSNERAYEFHWNTILIILLKSTCILNYRVLPCWYIN